MCSFVQLHLLVELMVTFLFNLPNRLRVQFPLLKALSHRRSLLSLGRPLGKALRDRLSNLHVPALLGDPIQLQVPGTRYPVCASVIADDMVQSESGPNRI